MSSTKVCSENQNALVQFMSQHQNCATLTELKKLEQWVCWKIEYRDGKPTKPPYDPKDPKQRKKASTNKPETWASFDAAYQAFLTGKYAGIGIVFTDNDPYIGVDLDHVHDINNGSVNNWAQTIIDSLDSYTEISPSGDGFHIIAKGDIPRGGNKKTLPGTDGDNGVFSYFSCPSIISMNLASISSEICL